MQNVVENKSNPNVNETTEHKGEVDENENDKQNVAEDENDRNVKETTEHNADGNEQEKGKQI